MKTATLRHVLSILLLASLPSALYARTAVLYSPSGTYAFPVAGEVENMAWTHFHWNGGNAVDIVPAPDLSPGSPAFDAFERSPIVAVVAGTVKPAKNEIGGTALLLFGNDGREYYYAHLSSTNITRPTRVRAGEQIGIIGNSGRWARYIEIHLHFAITSTWHRGLDWPNNINAAGWFEKTFGLSWIDQAAQPYPPAMPHGAPLAAPYRVVERYSRMRARNPDTASIRMEPLRGRAAAVPVYSTLFGEVRVMRATVFGLRLQITNIHTNQTVIYSGLSSAIRRTGEIVKAGEIVGWASGSIDYMYFDKGMLTNPTPMLATGVAAPDEGSPAGDGLPPAAMSTKPLQGSGSVAAHPREGQMGIRPPAKTAVDDAAAALLN